MDMTIRPAYLSHPLTVCIFIYFVVIGITLGGAEGFMITLLAGGFYGLLVLSIKGKKYIFKHGYLSRKHWYGPVESIKLSSIQYVEVKRRSFGIGDIVLYTPNGKFKIKGIRQSKDLADAIEAKYLAAS